MAVQDRQNRQKVIVSHEMMSVARILAGNIYHEMNARRGVNPNSPELLDYTVALTEGQFDGSPFVQGIVSGFAALLRHHKPTTSFLELCQAVPEEDNVVATQKKKAEADYAEALKTGFDIPGLGRVVPFDGDIYELLGAMFGGRKPH